MVPLISWICMDEIFGYTNRFSSDNTQFIQLFRINFSKALNFSWNRTISRNVTQLSLYIYRWGNFLRILWGKLLHRWSIKAKQILISGLTLECYLRRVHLVYDPMSHPARTLPLTAWKDTFSLSVRKFWKMKKLEALIILSDYAWEHFF